MKTLWILGNQLNRTLEGFDKIHREKDVVLMMESKARSRWRRVHKQKLVLIFSAMRHFARELKEAGYRVNYLQCDSFEEGLKDHFTGYPSEACLVHEPTDPYVYRVMEKNKKIPFILLKEKPLFIVEKGEWETYLPDSQSWKQEKVYRKLRKEQKVLMDKDGPAGGKWSFDKENRKPPKKGLTFTEPVAFTPDSVTEEVIQMVESSYSDYFGETENFQWPVTRKEALEALDHFIKHRLKTFGDYQDGMLINEPWMSHSLLSGVINIGLLTPGEVIKQAEEAYRQGKAPLASVEGFIRQLLGWREYIRGVYIRSMPDYQSVNYFNHQNPLPDYYWSASTDLCCVASSVKEVAANGYNHHIQRLMVLGNWANLMRVKPQQVCDWFLEVYADAYDWVVLPNVLGMALYADGGRMSTKPYISSGKYIQRMSNYCSSCKYDVNDKTGDYGCPFHALYWTFLEDHRGLLGENPRMKLIYANWDRQKPAEKKALLEKGRKWILKP